MWLSLLRWGFPLLLQRTESFWHLRINVFGSVPVIAMITVKNSFSSKNHEKSRMKYAQRRKNRVNAAWKLK